MSDEHNHSWQRRTLDRPAEIDFTDKPAGTVVVIETATLAECPNCHRPAVMTGLQATFGPTVIFVHKRTLDGQPVDVCVGVPLGEPELVVHDDKGEPVYTGPAEPDRDHTN